jgi:hypothetical protein
VLKDGEKEKGRKAFLNNLIGGVGNMGMGSVIPPEINSGM